jgi:hypothetical protein
VFREIQKKKKKKKENEQRTEEQMELKKVVVIPYVAGFFETIRRAGDEVKINNGSLCQ